MPVYANNIKLPDDTLIDIAKEGVLPPEPSPSNNTILNQHRWDEATFPTWDDGNIVNAKKFGAVGDGATDDTLSIQEAIDFAAKKGTLSFCQRGFTVYLRH